jgi:hypothetical protein
MDRVIRAGGGHVGLDACSRVEKCRLEYTLSAEGRKESFVRLYCDKIHYLDASGATRIAADAQVGRCENGLARLNI